MDRSAPSPHWSTFNALPVLEAARAEGPSALSSGAVGWNCWGEGGLHRHEKPAPDWLSVAGGVQTCRRAFPARSSYEAMRIASLTYPGTRGTGRQGASGSDAARYAGAAGRTFPGPDSRTGETLRTRWEPFPHHFKR